MFEILFFLFLLSIPMIIVAFIKQAKKEYHDYKFRKYKEAYEKETGNPWYHVKQYN